jgi:hypothetical protein
MVYVLGIEKCQVTLPLEFREPVLLGSGFHAAEEKGDGRLVGDAAVVLWDVSKKERDKTEGHKYALLQSPKVEERSTAPLGVSGSKKAARKTASTSHRRNAGQDDVLVLTPPGSWGRRLGWL